MYLSNKLYPNYTTNIARCAIYFAHGVFFIARRSEFFFLSGRWGEPMEPPTVAHLNPWD